MSNADDLLMLRRGYRAELRKLADRRNTVIEECAQKIENDRVLGVIQRDYAAAAIRALKQDEKL